MIEARIIYQDFYRIRRTHDDTEYDNLCAYLSPALREIAVEAEISWTQKDVADPLEVRHTQRWLCVHPLQAPSVELGRSFKMLQEALLRFGTTMTEMKAMRKDVL